MSGGHFNYDQYKLQMIADDIEQIILSNDSTEVDQWGGKKGYGFTPETIAEFKKGLKILHQAQIYAHRIDWLVSGDDGEDNFHGRLKADLGTKE